MTIDQQGGTFPSYPDFFVLSGTANDDDPDPAANLAKVTMTLMNVSQVLSYWNGTSFQAEPIDYLKDVECWRGVRKSVKWTCPGVPSELMDSGLYFATIWVTDTAGNSNTTVDSKYFTYSPEMTMTGVWKVTQNIGGVRLDPEKGVIYGSSATVCLQTNQIPLDRINVGSFKKALEPSITGNYCQQTNNGNVTVKVKSVLTACESSDRVEAYLDMGRQRIARSSDVSIFVPLGGTAKSFLLLDDDTIDACQIIPQSSGYGWCRGEGYSAKFSGSSASMNLRDLILTETFKQEAYGTRPPCATIPVKGPSYTLGTPDGQWTDWQAVRFLTRTPQLYSQCGQKIEQTLTVGGVQNGSPIGCKFQVEQTVYFDVSNKFRSTRSPATPIR